MLDIQKIIQESVHVKSGGKMVGKGDVTICIPSDDTQRIQEGHLLTEHILCESVEAAIMDQ